MFNQLDSKLEERIQQFVQELVVLVRQSAMETLRGVLDGGAGVQRRSRLPARARKAGRRSRSSGDLDQNASTIMDHVRANDGQGVIQIAEGTGVSLKDAKKAVVFLLKTGQLKKSGRRRGTRYHAGGARGARVQRAAKRAKRAQRKGRKARKAKKARARKTPQLAAAATNAA